MGLTVADVRECPFCGIIPELTKPDGERYYHPFGKDCIIAGEYWDKIGWNTRIALSPEKVVGMVILDREKLAEMICNYAYQNCIDNGLENFDTLYPTWEKALPTVKEYYYGIADAIISNKSKILGVKGKHD